MDFIVFKMVVILKYWVQAENRMSTCLSNEIYKSYLFEMTKYVVLKLQKRKCYKNQRFHRVIRTAWLKTIYLNILIITPQSLMTYVLYKPPFLFCFYSQFHDLLAPMYGFSFCRLWKCLRSLFDKDCRPKSVYRSSLIWVHTVYPILKLVK